MTILSLNNLKQNIQSGQCLLGLDFGAKTIGVSISDTLLIVASPLKTIKRTKFSQDLAHLEVMINNRNAGGLVIGLPLNLNGREGPRCQSTRQFASNILKHLEIPIAFWDERFSTSIVEKMLISEADMSRKKRRRVIDKIAATYILQGAIDSIKN